jgi:hypothetical protein
MDGLVEYETEDGAPVVFEASDETGSGVRLVSRGGLPTAQAVGTFESAPDGARSAAESALRVFARGRSSRTAWRSSSA